MSKLKDFIARLRKPETGRQIAADDLHKLITEMLGYSVRDKSMQDFAGARDERGQLISRDFKPDNGT